MPAAKTKKKGKKPAKKAASAKFAKGDKRADLAGPGISTYREVAKILPTDYSPILNPRDTQIAIAIVKEAMEHGLARELDLIRVECPLIVSKSSGVNDYLDRDGSRTPVDFPCGLGLTKRIDAQVVQAATKWKRMALAQFGMKPGQGLFTDMRAVRKDYFLDHDHSSYVDQWDWERVMVAKERNLDFLKEIVRGLWRVFKGAEDDVMKRFPQLATEKLPRLPDELEFFHAEEILEMYPTLPRKQRETAILQEHPAIFIIGIGWVLDDGYPHEMRAADYDDWATPVTRADGRPAHGLNGDILVWNPVTKRRHELSSMGIRVTKETLKQQLKITGQEAFLKLPYHKAILADKVPLSVGGGIGQSRTYQYLLRKAALGECSVTVWPEELHRICAARNIHLLR